MNRLGLTRILTIWCVMLLANQLSAQKLSYRQYSVTQGLASSTVYEMVQDQEGYIWMATENGVSRFNGYGFENFTTKDGLPGNEVQCMFTDSRGRIWFFSSNGKLGYYEGEVFYNTDNHPPLKNCQVDAFFISFFEDSQGQIWIGSESKEYAIIPPEGDAQLYQTHNGERLPGRVALFYEDENDHVISLVGFSLLCDLTDRETRIDLPGLRSRAYPVRTEEGDFYGDDYSEIYLKSHGFAGKLPHLEGYFGANITEMEPDGEQGFRVLTWNGAFRFHDRLLDTNQVEVFLPGVPVSSFLEDKEGNYWFGTLGQGVFMTHPQLSLIWDKEVGFQSNAVNAISRDEKGRIWLGFNRTKFGYLENGRFFSPFPDLYTYAVGGRSRSRSRCNFIVPNDDGSVFLGFDNILVRVSGSNKLDIYRIPCKGMTKGKNGDILISNYRGAMTIPAGTDWEEFKQGGGWRKYSSDTIAINRLLQIPQGPLYVGTNVGLREFKQGRLSAVAIEDPFLHVQVNDLVKGQEDEVILASHGEGVGILSGDRLTTFDKSDGLAGDFCKGLAMDSSGGIWVATNGGVSQIMNYHDPLNLQIRNYGVGEGLPSNDARSVFITGDSVWVGTEAGLSLIRIREQRARVKIPFFIRHLTINGEDKELQAVYDLPHHENHITIDYEGLFFTAPEQLTYRIKMIPLDTIWRTTFSRTADFPILPPGEYTFMADVSPNGHDWLEEPVSIQFYIRKPFWSTIWFLVLTVLLATVAIFLIVQRRIRTIQLRAELVQKAEEYKQVALRAQMNPHFIFNSLNSIQQFIALKNEKSALIYLSKFSRLIRMILEHSQKGMIPISDEVKALNFYLELEALRVDGKFTYEIEIAESIDPEITMIPGLLVQPVVENAIWHGLMPKGSGGILKVRIGREASLLKVEVEDNGIGREASQELNAQKRKDHNSVGLKNLEERLAVFSRGASVKGEGVRIIDLKDKNDKPIGTKVVLFIHSTDN